MRSAVLILLAISQIGAARIPVYGKPQFASSADAISLVALIASPAKYEGQHVRVEGFLSLEFEGSALYLDRPAFDAGLRKNAVWIDQPSDLKRPLVRRLSLRYASVEGTFVNQSGHYGLYAGRITNVRRIVPLETRADYYSHTERGFRWLMLDPRAWLLLTATFAIPGFTYFLMMRRRKD